MVNALGLIILAALLFAVFAVLGRKRKKRIQGIRQSGGKDSSKQLTKEAVYISSDSDLRELVFDNITNKINASGKKENEVFNRLSKGQKAVYAVWRAEAEINNGGFEKFYSNTFPGLKEETVKGFSLAGAAKFAQLMNSADEAAKIKNRGDRKKQFENLNEEFRKLYNEENLTALTAGYIRKNVEEFI